MKYIEQMKKGENLGYCAPYTKNGCYLIMHECNPETVIINGEYKESNLSTLAELANCVGAECDDLPEIIGKMQEIGCTECPARNVCGAMQEEV